MKLSSVHVLAFRNLADLKISPSEGVNVIYGDNGQGKTNLMEAVWLFTGARSFRGAKESEQIAFGEKSARAQIAYRGFGRENTARVTLGVQKSVFFNDVELEGLTAMAGKFNAVVFSPAHLTIIQGGRPKKARDGRRDFADSPAIPPLMAQYARQLCSETRCCGRKNHAALLDTLDVGTSRLQTARFMRTRMSYISALSLLQRDYAEISNGAKISMAYAGEFGAYRRGWRMRCARSIKNALRRPADRLYRVRTAQGRFGYPPGRDIGQDVWLAGTAAKLCACA